MSDSIDSQVVKNTNDREETQRRAFITRVCGEEHNATFKDKTATLYFATDGRLIQMSEFKFKLIITGKSTPSQPGADWTEGFDTYAYEAWLEQYPIGAYVDIDKYYGPQCADYANAFWLAQVSRRLDLGGTILVKNAWLFPSSRATNAGDEFDLVYDWNLLVKGDWVLWGNSETGHIAMVVDVVKKPDGVAVDVIKVRGQNQSGQQLPEGGWPVTETYMSSSGFLGAFRYKAWHKDSPGVLV